MFLLPLLCDNMAETIFNHPHLSKRKSSQYFFSAYQILLLIYANMQTLFVIIDRLGTK